MLKIKNAQFPQPAPKPMPNVPDPSWKGNPPPKWENDPHPQLETHATKQEEIAQKIALSLRKHDALTTAYIAKELLAHLGGFENAEELIVTKIQELAYGDDAVEQLGQRTEDEKMGRADARMDQMKDDSFQWDNPW